MTIIEIPIGQLKPYKNNARKNEQAIPKVAESIKKYGFKNPIIIDKDNVIICGHTRLEASKMLGLKKVPCIIATDLTEEQVKEFRLVENRTNEFADWDYEKLLSELDDLDLSEFEFPELQYEDTISQSELEDMLTDGIKTSEKQDDHISIPLEPKKTDKEKQHSISIFLNQGDDVTELLHFLDSNGFVYKEY